MERIGGSKFRRRGGSVADFFAQDLRFGARLLRRSPGFALIAALTLALGIGATTAVFTAVRAVLLRPLAYRDPDRLVELTRGATPMRYDLIRASARSYSMVGAYLGGTEDVALSGNFVPEVLKESRVSANFLSILGTEPLLGRSFTAKEDSPSGPPVAIISANLWQRRFGGDSAILGRVIDLGGTPHTVVGVMSQDFQFPHANTDVWVPRPAKNVTQLSPMLTVFARLAPQATLAQANAELKVLNGQYATEHPGMLDMRRRAEPERVAPIKEELVSSVRMILLVLFGAVSFVLLIACANVAGLLLARAGSRGREFALRSALGASRRRLVAQLLVESTLLALAGGALGLLLARWMLSGITRFSALDLPRSSEIRLDASVATFAVVLSLATGLLFGLLPSLAASRFDLIAALKSRGESAASTRLAGWFNARSALVAGQVALSLVLLIGASLLIESLARLSRVDPGFDSSHLLTFRISISPARYDTMDKKSAFFDELVRRVEALRGVRGATVAMSLPFRGYAMQPVQPADQPARKLFDRPLGAIQFISQDYFKTLRIPLRRGREFDDRDRMGAAPAVILNEALVRKLWPDDPNFNPVGRTVLLGAKTNPYQVIGVVGDVRQSLDGDLTPSMYRPALQEVLPSMVVAARTDGDPLGLADAVRRTVLAMDPNQPISEVRTMDELAQREEGQRRLVLLLLGAFAATAVLLTLVGIYGSIAYWVVQRTRELGIRRALGAPSGSILRLVVGRGVAMAAIGVSVGILGALGLTRLLHSLLFNISPADPATYAAVAVTIGLLALGASYLPARRAATVDPMVALRYE